MLRSIGRLLLDENMKNIKRKISAVDGKKWLLFVFIIVYSISVILLVDLVNIWTGAGIGIDMLILGWITWHVGILHNDINNKRDKLNSKITQELKSYISIIPLNVDYIKKEMDKLFSFKSDLDDEIKLLNKGMLFLIVSMIIGLVLLGEIELFVFTNPQPQYFGLILGAVLIITTGIFMWFLILTIPKLQRLWKIHYVMNDVIIKGKSLKESLTEHYK